MSNSIRKEEPLRKPGISAARAMEPLLHVLPVLGLQSGEEHTEPVLRRRTWAVILERVRRLVCVHLEPGCTSSRCLHEEHGLGW